MRKLLDTLLMSAVFAAVLGSFALADVASGPAIAVYYGTPVLIIAAAVIVIILVVRGVRKEKGPEKRRQKG
jgi:hypothetical protein